MPHIPRLYRPGRIGPGPLTLDAEASRHLGQVLRMRPGETFLVFGGDGSEWLARIDAAAGKQGVAATVLELTRQEPAAALQVELCCALVRAAKFDLVVEKCTVLGADVIRPLTCERTNRGDDPSGPRRERWERIAVEAAEQSGRLRVPVIAAVASLDEMLQRQGTFLFADGSGAPWDEAARLIADAGHVRILVGPEGGWSSAETAKARAAGGIVTRLGPNILRTETAAMAAVALVRARS